MTRLCAAALVLGSLVGARSAEAFCGFYVSGADSKMFNDATQVVLLRDGTRTVLAMQNDYKGPPQNFALVVPVPVVLREENVKTLLPEVFEHVDKLSSPRLVEYWEQDPCPAGGDTLGHGSGLGTGAGFGSGFGRLGGAHRTEDAVKVEAEFSVGEYEIVILSAKDSSALDAWLHENNYKVPDNVGPALHPYVAAGSKFFVARVNISKVKMVGGRAALSPLRFHYDSDKFELPVKLGLLNSSGTQDLIVHILGPGRYEVANYPNVTIPTNLDVSESARTHFGEFYTALYDRTVREHKRAVVTEYSWGPTSCDPCPDDMSGLTVQDLAALGADLLPNVLFSGTRGSSTTRPGAPSVSAGLPPEVVARIVRQNTGRLRLCYENSARKDPTLQGKVVVDFDITAEGQPTNVRTNKSELRDVGVNSCVQKTISGLSFPQPGEKKTVHVSYPFVFANGGSGSGRAAVSSRNTDDEPMTLTRLHVRYDKDSLGQDLVFRRAAPIVGGREMRDAGKLETGAVKAPPKSASFFQARYAIRHEWKGPITCKEPRRGVWGPRWIDADAGDAASDKTVAATKLAFTSRGSVDGLGAFTNISSAALTNTLATSPSEPAYDPKVAASSDATSDAGGPPSAMDAGASTPAPPPPPRCGCRVVSSDAASWPSMAFAATIAAGWLRRRKRRAW